MSLYRISESISVFIRGILSPKPYFSKSARKKH
jgi:hypothetical protein